MPTFIKSYAVSVCILIVIALTVVLPALAGDARQAEVYQIASPITVDGILNEAIWQEAASIGDLVQVEPHQGEKPTEPTRVWLAYTKDTLYIAVRCIDGEPDRIIATAMARDDFLMSDDNIELVLDTFHDLRNAYYFATNPAGILVDGRVTENRFPNREWDGIWNVKTRVDDEGWTAEFELPFKSLGFKADSRSWGFNISRQLGRLRETSRWASPSLDIRLSQMARAGAINGLEGLSQGFGLDIKPYAIGGFSRDIEAKDTNYLARDVGGEIFYRITPNLVSSTTFNTDFAETEVDTRQTNLTRFSLFFPERRGFFLEDAGVFEFGSGAGAAGGGGGGGGGGRMRRRSVDLLPFFSRRIGLVEVEDENGDIETAEVPIRVGEKLTGKLGRFDLGLMDVQTGEVDELPGANLAVGRVKANFWKQSYVGALFTNGSPEGGVTNHVEGVDMRLATANFLNRGKSFFISAFGTRAKTAGVHGKDMAYGGDIVYPNDFLWADYRWMTIGENYDPALGYVPRTGVRITSSRLELGPRPKFWGIRQVIVGANYQNYYSLAHKSNETMRIQLTPLEVQFNTGDRFSYSYNPNLERLYEPFEIREGIFVPIGRYATGAHRVSVFSSGSRPLSARADLETGSFYSGSRKQAGFELTWKKNSHMSTSIELEQNWVRLKEGNFTARLLSYRLDYSFTPLITLSNFLQYDNDTQNIGIQSRLRWILKPGNELFFVVNHAWQENEFDRFVTAQTHARVKLNYTFRF